GFSVNPARTFSSAVFAGTWQGVWIYFAAPCLGMLSAAAVYIKTVGLNRVYCAKVFHDTRSVCPFRCEFEHVYEETRSAMPLEKIRSSTGVFYSRTIRIFRRRKPGSRC